MVTGWVASGFHAGLEFRWWCGDSTMLRGSTTFSQYVESKPSNCDLSSRHRGVAGGHASVMRVTNFDIDECQITVILI